MAVTGFQVEIDGGTSRCWACFSKKLLLRRWGALRSLIRFSNNLTIFGHKYGTVVGVRVRQSLRRQRQLCCLLNEGDV